MNVALFSKNPVLNGTLVTPTSRVCMSAILLLLIVEKWRNDVEVTSISLTTKTDFVEIQLVQKFKEKATYREHFDPICLNFPQFKENVSGL